MTNFRFGTLDELRAVGTRMAEDVRGQRLIDLCLNAIEIIDRNLYERTCDVRWWATDAAVIDAASHPAPDKLAEATRRLGVILSAYTVYLDLWICDTGGKLIAHGRPDRHHGLVGLDVGREAWFRDALASRTGDDYAVADVMPCPALGGAATAVYAAIREGGRADAPTRRRSAFSASISTGRRRRARCWRACGCRPARPRARVCC